MTNKYWLHNDWILEAPDNSHILHPIPAQVPGCVHTDLLANQLIDDPYWDCNEVDLQWIGESTWRYTCKFDLDALLLQHHHIDLVCLGLDTIAQIELNGHLVAETQNMHTAYRFDVKKHLQPTANRLVITFSPATGYARQMEAEHGARPYVPRTIPNTNLEAVPFNFIRKMACNFGWDWGPILITAGIWQPICLEAWNTARIENVRPLITEANEHTATLEVFTDLDVSDDTPLTLKISLKAPERKTELEASIAVNSNIMHTAIQVDNPALWWPRGYGDQPLYELTVELYAEQSLLDQWQGRVGLRTTRLNTQSDDQGTRFVIEINDQPIFCKGANWIPDDCFPTRVDETRYRERIQQAFDANMNMLRVWGGGIYESAAFYRICDEMGMLVWQDFLFACATYSEAPPFDSLVEAEVRYQVTRLSPHPSLVIWNGNNENIWAYHNWGWKNEIGERTWGKGFYLELLPRIVDELDPSRPYWPGSPYSGSMESSPNDDNHGNQHLWDAYFGEHYAVYRKHPARFVSEFGFQGAANHATYREALPSHQLYLISDSLRHHQRTETGEGTNTARLQEVFEFPEKFDDWVYLLQLNQARALILGVEWFRSIQPICMGTIYWQLNDCWPATSWAAIDSAGRPKLLWYATRRFYAPHLITLQPTDGSLALIANNDSARPWIGQVQIKRMNFAGNILATIAYVINIPPRTCYRVAELPAEFATPSHPTAELITAEIGDLRTFWFFDIDKNLEYPEPKFSVALNGSRLTITAHTLIRDLSILVDYLDPQATISDQLLTLLPGDSFTFDICSDRDLKLSDLTSPPVLQCANFYGNRSRTK